MKGGEIHVEFKGIQQRLLWKLRRELLRRRWLLLINNHIKQRSWVCTQILCF